MKNKTVIIMANGQNTRWNGENKCLALIDNEPLICRTIRQVREYGVEPYVATSVKEVKKNVDCKIIDVGFTQSAEETWYKTKDFWKGRTVILWGDVYFSDRTIKEIMVSQGLKFFGRRIHYGEGYACAYDERHFKFIIECLTETDFYDWKFYDYMAGMPLTANKNKIWYDHSIWHECDIYTRDIDTKEEYKALLEILDKKPKEIVTICFDDGLVKSCEKAIEIAEPFKISFFIVTDWAKKKGEIGFWKEVQEAGHDVQSHSATHSRILDRNYEREFKESYEFIKELHGRPYIIAYPYEITPKIFYPSPFDWTRFGVIMPQFSCDAYYLGQMVRREQVFWKQIVFHGLDGEGYASINSAEFAAFIEWLKEQPYEVKTMAEVYNEYIEGGKEPCLIDA